MSAPVNPPILKAYKVPSALKLFSFAAVAVGVLSFVSLQRSDVERAWVNFLMDYFFWLSIGLAGVFFAALQYLSGARWSAPIRRVGEAFIAYLPISFVLFFAFFIPFTTKTGEHTNALHLLFEWTHLEVVKNDAALAAKSAYLNENFMLIRHIGLYIAVFLLGGWMIRNSLRQDASGDVRLTKLSGKIAAPFMLLFGWGFTFAAFDLVMSLSPHWFSTIFGIYCWAGLFLSGLAMMVLWVLHLLKTEHLKGFVNENHLHDLGKLLFAFTVFWAYIAVCQYILIWYANLPEETIYFLVRQHGSWKNVSFALAIVKFIIPFFLLLSRPVKRNTKLLALAAFWILGAQWLDLYWLVVPNFTEHPYFGWEEVGMFVGFSGLFVFAVSRFLSRVPVVAIKDPGLSDALHHHQ